MDVETGKVVGINAAIRAHMEGTSFAIPINRVREIMHELAAGKVVHHVYLGISLATCTPEWARQNNGKAAHPSVQIPEVYGALVYKVFPRVCCLCQMLGYSSLIRSDIFCPSDSCRTRWAQRKRRLACDWWGTGAVI